MAQAIASIGCKADLQVRSAGFKVDITVRHPERAGEYLLAVECDRASYHSAIWARERDRLMQEILEGFGLRFHRIWSADRFHNRSVELDRLRSAIDDAVSSAGDPGSLKGANGPGTEGPVADPEDVDGPPEDDTELVVRELTVPAYQKASLSVGNASEPHEIPVAKLSVHAAKVVEDEEPIHTDEVVRRIAAGFGKKRTGSRIQDAALKALKHAKRSGSIAKERSFWLSEQLRSDMPVRDRSAEVTPTTKPEYLLAMEIMAAADMILVSVR